MCDRRATAVSVASADLNVSVRLLVQYARPVHICLTDVPGDVPAPFAPDSLVEVEVEFAFMNGPGIGLYVSRVPAAGCPSSVAAVTGGVLLRAFREEV